MTRRLLVLRPEPGAQASAARAREDGWNVVMTPLFTTAPCAWTAPDPSGFDAVMMTSANAARLGGPELDKLTHLPLYAVGPATAAAAKAAGFTQIRSGVRDGAALLALAAADGIASLLHLAGREHLPLARDGIRIERRIVYRSDAVSRLPDGALEALEEGAVTLLHSPRAASLFAALVDAAELSRERIRIAAISPAALAEAGGGWGRTAAADAPGDTALLAAAASLCD